MDNLIEWHLLYIEVTGEEIIAFLPDDKGKEKQSGKSQRQQEELCGLMLHQFSGQWIHLVYMIGKM